MKWYTAITKYSTKEHLNQLRVALHTCFKYTKFKPYVVYDEDFELIEELKIKYNKLVNFLKVKSDILTEYENIYSDQHDCWFIKGTYLRCEISQLEPTDSIVLYTDLDVMFQPFLQKYTEVSIPNFFSAAPEFDPTNYSYFNAGVMFINIANMNRTYENFKRFIIANLPKLKNVAHDQGALFEFYKNKWTKLKPEYNWKPQWGVNNEAPIIHMHGAKANRIENYFNKIKQENLIEQIISINPNSCKYYLDMFYKNLEEYYEQ